MYITTSAVPKFAHMDVDDLWFGDDGKKYGLVTTNDYNTVTIKRDELPRSLMHDRKIYDMSIAFQKYVDQYKDLLSVDRHGLYRTFHVPKSSGGLRRIDAPNDALMTALRNLKAVFEQVCGANLLYHTSSFAYVHGRNTIECVRRHQLNQSKWFGKFDLHNFFGSTTKEFLLSMFKQIYPFCQLELHVLGSVAFEQALDLCFLDGVLPQGTPMSPMLTNIMMIPIDFEISKRLRELGMVYTRYADDFLISSRHPFRFRDVEQIIVDVLKEFGAPFELNTQKTRYGSVNGANWNFGIMLNKDNKMTIGRSKKKQFESMLTAYAKDKKNGTAWSLEDVQHLDGLRAYYKAVEGETIDRIVEHISRKQGVNIKLAIKADLRGVV